MSVSHLSLNKKLRKEMDPESETTPEPEVPEPEPEPAPAPEPVVIRKAGRPKGSKNKAKPEPEVRADTRTDEADVNKVLYETLMKRLDDMEKRQEPKKPRAPPRPRKALTGAEEPPSPQAARREASPPRLSRSEITRQFMEQMNEVQNERNLQRQRMYAQFLPQ